MNEKEIHKLKEAFQEIDKDNSGMIDINELKINQGLKSQHKFEGLNFQGSKGDKVTTDFVKTLFDELYE